MHLFAQIRTIFKLVGGKKPAFKRWKVVSGDRKRNHLACNHEAHIPSKLWRGFRYFSEAFLSRPRCALRKISGGVWRVHIPPMLAAQADFPSAPL
jgi:hypothetical protein